MFLQWPPRLEIHLPLGVGMSIAFILASVYRLPAWVNTVIAAVTIYIPQYITYNNYVTMDTDPVWFVRPGYEQHIFTHGSLIALLMAIGAFAQPLYRELRAILKR
jgi:hypothetical protein